MGDPARCTDAPWERERDARAVYTIQLPLIVQSVDIVRTQLAVRCVSYLIRLATDRVRRAVQCNMTSTPTTGAACELRAVCMRYCLLHNARYWMHSDIPPQDTAPPPTLVPSPRARRARTSLLTGRARELHRLTLDVSTQRVTVGVVAAASSS